MVHSVSPREEGSREGKKACSCVSSDPQLEEAWNLKEAKKEAGHYSLEG
jgi:hypothetical protein